MSDLEEILKKSKMNIEWVQNFLKKNDGKLIKNKDTGEVAFCKDDYFRILGEDCEKTALLSAEISHEKVIELNSEEFNKFSKINY